MNPNYILAKQSLKQKRQQLILSFLKDKEPDFMLRYARLLDDYFCQSFSGSAAGPKIGISKNPYAIIATGGYGRDEQSIQSDVDILFLFKKVIPREAEALVREIVYPLWDIGLEVGYATRSLKECVQLAAKDYEILTSLLDVRFVCGMSPLYSELTEQLFKKVISRRIKKIAGWLFENNGRRHHVFGDASYLLEPNLKEGQGGLRDYHTMMWLAKLQNKVRVPKDLVYQGYLSHDEFERLSKALSFIWSVRNRLHHLAGRKCDQLHFEYQTQLARRMNFTVQNRRKPVENFLGTLHEHMEFIKQQQLVFLHELGFRGQTKSKRIFSGRTKYEGLTVKNNLLHFVSAEQILNAPELILKIFEESVRLKIPLSAEARRLVNQFSSLVGEHLLSSPLAVKLFERILAAPALTFTVINEMLHSGFLTAFIPEMKTIVHRIQYNAYHIYPVARHSLQTVWTIRTFDSNDSDSKNHFYSSILGEIKHKNLLLWAALLHDIGKGAPKSNHADRGAVIAKHILNSKGLKKDDSETVSFLIRNHLLLKEIATRRDIHDEETAIFCARKIMDVERLKMLYLLSVADAMSTGPKAWNDWTAGLLKSFYLKVLKILENGELASRSAITVFENKKKEIISSGVGLGMGRDQTALFEVMSPRYLLYTPAAEIRSHVELYHRLAASDFVWQVEKSHDANTRTVTICAKDRPGLFSKIAGVFTLNGIDVLDAQVYTWRNRIALDIFRVTPPPDQIFETERWFRAENNLRAALEGKLDLANAIREKKILARGGPSYSLHSPHKIVVDNESSSFFTIIEVFANDFPGLLFTITDALFRHGLDVWVAKIATKIDQVVDVFYVRDFDGQKSDAPDGPAGIITALDQVFHNVGQREATGTYS